MNIRRLLTGFFEIAVRAQPVPLAANLAGHPAALHGLRGITGLPITHVILTHAHWDHIGGLDALTTDGAADDVFLSELEFALDRPRTRELVAFDAFTPHVREIRDIR